MDFIDFLKRVNEIGLKKGALEKACGFSNGKITKLETGQQHIKPSTVQETLEGLSYIIDQLTELLQDAQENSLEIPEGKYCVYEFTFPNGKKYYGHTFSIESRWQNGYGYKKQKVGEAIEEFGWENVEKKIIAENLTKSNAQMLERSLIKAVGTDIELLGYNVY